MKSKNEKDLAKIGKVQVFTTRWNDLSAYKIVAIYFNREKQKNEAIDMAYCFTSFILFLHSLGPESESWSGMDDTDWRTATDGHGPWRQMTKHPIQSLMDTGEQFRVFLNWDFLQ